MSHERSEFSDGEMEPGQNDMGEPKKATQVRHRQQSMAKDRATRTRVPATDEDAISGKEKRPEKHQVVQVNTENDTRTPWIIKYQNWVWVPAFVYVLTTLVTLYYLWDHDSRIQQLNTPSNPDIVDLTPLSTKYNELESQLRKKYETMDDKSDKTHNILSNFKDKTEQWMTDVKQQTDKIDDIIRNVSKQSEKLKELEEIKSALSSLNDLTQSISSELNQKGQEIKSIEESAKQESKIMRDSLEQTGSVFKERLRDLQKKYENRLKETETKFETDIEQMVDPLKSDLKNTKSTVDDVLIPNVLKRENVIYAFALVVALCLVIFAYVKVQPRPQVRQPVNGTRSKVHPVWPVEPDAYPAEQLESGLCIVRFDEVSKELCERLKGQVLRGIPDVLLRPNARYLSVVSDHKDIGQLPRVRLYILLVHFSERHVIIEEPNIGQGDIRRSTVDHIRALQGDYLIIYVKDPGSRQMETDSLYNRNIYAVKAQNYLRELNGRGRFFSVYDSLSPFQQNCVKNIIQDTFQ